MADKRWRKTKKNRVLYEYIAIMFGTFLLALSITVFLEPLNLVTGGVSGLAIVIRSVANDRFGIDIPLWATNLTLNIPLFIIGTRARGFGFLSKTIFATVFLSVALFLSEFIYAWVAPYITGMDYLLAGVFGGVIGGFGLGVVFRHSATTGGSDLAASIVNRYAPHIQIARAMMFIDTAIIIVGFFVFGPIKAMYAIISVYIASQMAGFVLEGLYFAKAAFIISDKSAEIGDLLIHKLRRGATALHGKGLYSNNEKDVLLCVVSSKEIVRVKELVKSVDEWAFVIVADVREALGEGFSLPIRAAEHTE